MRFRNVVEGAPCVLGVGWKSAFAVMFVLVLGGPTAPTGVERESCGSPMEGSGKEHEVGLGLGLGLGLGVSTGLVAEFLTLYSCWRRAHSAVRQNHFVVEGQ